MKITLDGLDGVARDITTAANRTRPEAGRVVVEQVGRLAQKMRDRVPIDEGTTLESITADSTPTMESDSAVSAEAGPEWFVARYLEDGTSKMAPRSFIEPSLAEQLPEFGDAIRNLRDHLLT